jgi:hypothetical protein
MNTPTNSEALPLTNCSAFERLRLSQTARPMDVFAYWKREGYLDLNPPYQRGDVWGVIRRRNLIRSIMLGIPIPSIIINDRFAANWGNEIAVIDGKQRITTILMFLEGDLKVPAEWFGIDGDEITFPELPIARQRGMKNMPLPLCEGQLRTIEEEREVFELVNFGGVPQGESDYLPNNTNEERERIANDALFGGWREVPKAEWDAWVESRGADTLVNNCSEPPTLQARLHGEVIAIAKLYDGSNYHGGKSPKYLLPNASRLASADPETPNP